MSTPEPGAFASLEPGEAVLFTWEEAEQDGYAYRATRVRRPTGGTAARNDAGREGEDEDEDEEDDVFALTDVRIEFDDD